ncbi:hypothetical protein HNY73_005395 [Argiope bruennichi]|uniref:Uncharacterized protein n=1 Tax=Argiope bruennichi TaxID=94029 RepID=A0A8T0FJH3_ARGBR|nr:hypothetical protein HNY73_005395 [Argiope bruennichi]
MVSVSTRIYLKAPRPLTVLITVPEFCTLLRFPKGTSCASPIRCGRLVAIVRLPIWTATGAHVNNTGTYIEMYLSAKIQFQPKEKKKELKEEGIDNNDIIFLCSHFSKTDNVFN